MGAMQTPSFLAAQGVRSSHLGRHLTVHPTGLVGGVFDGIDFRNEHAIPQGVGIGDLAGEGIRFEGGTPPLGVYGLAIRSNGPRFRELVDDYRNTAFMGFMVSDTSTGRVMGSVKGHPLVTYWVNRTDLQKHVKATAMAARLLLRAGARYVNLVTCSRDPILTSERDVDRFLSRSWHARHFTMTAYHPLGTARIATRSADGVCDPEHRVFGVQGLYVMDGSNVPSSLGVNPQITIMALSARAARRLADELSRGAVAA
jgi:hypothetical protein